MDLQTTDHPRGTWVCQGDERIAFWYCAGRTLDIFKFGPDEESIATANVVPRVYDMTSYFNLHAMLRWKDPQRGDATPPQVEEHWLPQPDGGLRFEVLGRSWSSSTSTRWVPATVNPRDSATRTQSGKAAMGSGIPIPTMPSTPVKS